VLPWTQEPTIHTRPTVDQQVIWRAFLHLPLSVFPSSSHIDPDRYMYRGHRVKIEDHERYEHQLEALGFQEFVIRICQEDSVRNQSAITAHDYPSALYCRTKVFQFLTVITS
jgi:hypothetical protein